VVQFQYNLLKEVFEMAEENAVLMYKGHPLMRKDNMIYYGSMADSHIVMLQILESKKVGDNDVASKVSIQLQLTDPNARSRDRVVKKSEKDGLYTALDLGHIWLERALAGK
jgi:hypothetical protein